MAEKKPHNDLKSHHLLGVEGVVAQEIVERAEFVVVRYEEHLGPTARALEKETRHVYYSVETNNEKHVLKTGKIWPLSVK